MSEELTKKRVEAKQLLEYLKELESSDMSHIEVCLIYINYKTYF